MTDETPHIPETLAQYLTENQDPQQVERIYNKVSQLLTRGEQVIYIAVQKALTYDPTPEIVVLTNRRFMHYRQNLMGSAQFTDYIWRELKEAKLEEGVMRATLTLFAANGETLRIDNLVKEQARRLLPSLRRWKRTCAKSCVCGQWRRSGPRPAASTCPA